jgi:hypothetical protein
MLKIHNHPSKFSVQTPALSDTEDDDFRHKHNIRGEPTSVVYYSGKKLFDIRGAGFEPHLTNSVQNGIIESSRRDMCPLLTLVMPHPEKSFFYLPDITPAPAPKPV